MLGLTLLSHTLIFLENILDTGNYFVFLLGDFNVPGISNGHDEYGLGQPDHFHPPFITDSTMPIRRSEQNFNTSLCRPLSSALQRTVYL
jgi:hypothetical protein